jgi:4-carboxymuconolactone decarboxylase
VSEDKLEIGSKVRREVLGDAHVDAAAARTTDFDSAFQTFITETAWGSVWARPDMDRHTRSLITISILAALGRVGELEMHLRASRNVGVDPHEVAEALLHVAVYAGVPAAHAAVQIAKRVLEDTQ